jgi:hypothetical protein
MLRLSRLHQRLRRGAVNLRAIIAALAVHVAASAAGSATVLPHRVELQSGEYLCWAAASVTAWSTQNVTLHECELATTWLAGGPCCLPGKVTNAKLASCNAPSPWEGDYLKPILASQRWRVAEYDLTGFFPTDALLSAEIAVGRPVVSVLHYGQPCKFAGHAVTVVGRDPATTPVQLVVVDPRKGALSQNLSDFQCGPVGRGHCAAYHAMAGAVPSGAVVTEPVVGCRGAMAAAVTFALAAVPAIAPLITIVNSRLSSESAQALGIPNDGPISCDDEPIHEEYAGTPGVRNLLLLCARGTTPFFIAVNDDGTGVEVPWFGARNLAFGVDTVRGNLPPGAGALVLRSEPTTGEALLFRRGQEGAAVRVVPLGD